MKIKVQCGCGSRFEFEVEPVHGRMPVSLACPACGADATGLADAAIQEQLNVPGVPTLRSSGLKIAGDSEGRLKVDFSPRPETSPDADTVAPPAEGEVQFCSKHRQESAVEHCRVCGKPICLKCMAVFGYLCSPFCKSQALEKKLSLPVCPHQKSVQTEREFQALKRGVAIAAITVISILGAWVWYAWFGVMPKLVYSITLPETGKNDSYYDLIGPGRVLLLEGNQLAVHDIGAGRRLWSATLESPVTVGLSGGPRPDVLIESNEVWVSLPSRLARFNLKTGTRGEDVVLKAPASILSPDEHSLLVVSSVDADHQVLTRISLASGAVETEEKTSVSSSMRHAAGTVGNNSAPSASLKLEARISKPQREMPVAGFASAGVNAVELDLKLLESKIVYVDTMKPKGASVFDSSSLNASQSLEASQEMMNDAQRARTGGKREEDLSRYQVTLHRWFAHDTTDWSGEVVGPPDFFSLKTVDLLVSDHLVQVFDKSNKKLWESKLTYTIRGHRKRGERGLPPPCVEWGNVVYLADQGMLTAFGAPDGNVIWRLTSVGISQIQFDDKGKLYVDTTTADPELIQYPDDTALRKRAQPLLLKVEPTTGQTIWTGEKGGTSCALSGRFVYEERTSVASALLHLGQGEKYDFNLYRLGRDDGRELWRYYQSKPALGVAVWKTWILLQFPDELQVLRFYSL